MPDWADESNPHRDVDLDDPLIRRAIAAVMDELETFIDRMDAAEPHVLLVTDPTTGSRHVTGVWPDRLHAKIAAILHKASDERVDAELANVTYEPLVFIETDLQVPTEVWSRRAEAARPEDVAEVEARYGQSIGELAEEAERGYDVGDPLHDLGDQAGGGDG